MNKNILYFYDAPFYPSLGGIERVTDSIARELQKRGYTVYYLFHRKHKERFLNYQSDFESFFLPYDKKLLSKENIRYYRELLDKKQISVVVNQHFYKKTVMFFCKAHPDSVRFIDCVHCKPDYDYSQLFQQTIRLKNNTLKDKFKRIRKIIKYPYTKWKVKHSFRKTYALVEKHRHTLCLLSEKYKPTIAYFNKQLADKAIAIPNPNTYPDVSQIPSKEKIVLYVGRLDNSDKRVNFLIKIWSKIYQKHPDWTLYIAGDGPDKDSLHLQARPLDRIVFLGKVNPIEYYQKTSMICLTSLFEGFPMCLTEGMQWGCIPFSFNSYEAVTDIICHQKNGIIIPAYNKDIYANELSTLMNNPFRRQQYSQEAFQHIKKYNIDHIITQWEALFSS